MEKTLIPDDMIVINKLSYTLGELKRGDIIVFKCPLTNPFSKPKDYIKRIIGLPGDELSIENNKIILNGKIVEENYIYEIMDDDTILHAHYHYDGVTKKGTAVKEEKKIKIPAGYVFAMGDNRNNSRDSRFWGYLPIKDIKGKAFFRYWPIKRMGFIR